MLARQTCSLVCKQSRRAAQSAWPLIWPSKPSITFLNSLRRDCQITGRGSNLDSNLNSATWPTSCTGFIASESQNKLCGVSILFKYITDAKFEPSEVPFLRLMPSIALHYCVTIGRPGELQIRKLFCLLGPGLSDDVTKSQTGIFRFGPKSHTNRGFANGKCALRRHILALQCELLLSLIEITDTIYISGYLRRLFLLWGDGRWFVWNPQ